MNRKARPLLGTIVDICVFDESPLATVAIESAFERIKEINDSMSFHEFNSDLSRLNQSPSGCILTISKDLVSVLTLSLDLNLRSGGAFNPMIAPILQDLELLPTWGNKSTVHSPSLAAAIEFVSDYEVFKKQPCCIDLAGIAKGYAVDQACSALQSFGIENAIVNAGGDLKAIGENSHKIAIRHPQLPETPGLWVSIKDQALATSASYFSKRRTSDLAASVLIDGRSGDTCRSMESISIKARNCVYADALTKIAFCLKDSELEPILEHFEAEMIVLGVEESSLKEHSH